MGGCVSSHGKSKSSTEADTDHNRHHEKPRKTPRNSGPIAPRFSGPITPKFSGPINSSGPIKFSGPIAPRFSTPISIIKDPSGDDIFRRYQLGKELGRGEFGVTYRCLDTETGETVACKKISKSKLKSEIVVEDVRREVKIMRHLPPHPNIVRYKEVYEDKEAVYLIMELCEGGELFDRIVARGHYTEQAAAMVARTIFEVVQVCHNHGVVHRDLKPENFLFSNVTENSPLKAIDFGLSIFFKPGQRFSDIVGSPYYMAPEVLRRDYGPECDVWSAGVILYILLCGLPPFWAETEEGIAHAIVKSKLNLEKDPWPKISEGAKDLVRGMLDPNPYNRMTIEEVLAHRWIQNPDKVPTCPLGEGVRHKIKQFSLMNKFKKTALRVVAYNLPDEEVNQIENIFHMMDIDNNGNLSFEELKHGLHMMGQVASDADVKILMDAADVDGNGTISCEEFVTLTVHLKRMSNDEHLREAFQFFDKNRSGFIEFEELREALLNDNLGPNSDQVIEEIMFAVDLNKDGQISYEEFEAMMTTGMDWRMASRKYSRARLNALSLRMFKDRSGPLNIPNRSGPLKISNKSGLLQIPNKSLPLKKSSKSEKMKNLSKSGPVII